MMASELEAVALRLFDERGFANVTVEEITSEAHISVRTFYRYFAAKEDVLQLRIVRRSEVLGEALAARPADEPPLRSLRVAIEEEFSAVDPIVLRRWISVISDNPNVMKGVVGAIQLKIQPVIAGFFGSRLGLPSEGLVPTMLAAAAIGRPAGGSHAVVHPRWRLGDHDVRKPRRSREGDQHRPQNLGGGRRAVNTKSQVETQRTGSLSCPSPKRSWDRTSTNRR